MASGLDLTMNRRRGSNDITLPRANGITPPRARKRSCAPNVGGLVSHLSAVWHSLFLTSPPERCQRSPVKRAGAIVAEFGFNHVEAQLCTKENLEFRALRDGKPFSIKIKANGELAKVQRLR